MGFSVSCAYFKKCYSFLEWVVRQESQISSVLHYLYEFLFIGLKGSRVCSALLHTMELILPAFGVPLAPEKTEGPVSVIKFLGIVIDSELIECRLPKDKLLDSRRRSGFNLCWGS